MMPFTMTMPEMGESVVEGVVVRWLKREGDPIERDEPLLEVMTDKVNAELPATTDGRLLRILAGEGATVPVGGPLAEIAPAGEAAATTTGVGAGDAEMAMGRHDSQARDEVEADGGAVAHEAADHDAGDGEGGQHRRYSPLVRRLAREHELPLDQIAGTGLGGRVTKRDVLAFLAGRGAGSAEPADGRATTVAAPDAPTTAEPIHAAPAVAAPAAPTHARTPATAMPGADEEFVQLTPMRRAIAEHMVRSVTTAPHATTVHQVDMTRLVEWRAANRRAFRAQHGVDISPLTFIVAATAAALREFPLLNSSWGGDKIILKKQVNIGVAVGLEDGLIVPVIRDADGLNLVGLTRALARLVQRARDGQLTPDEVQGGTFTVNNVGVFGSIVSTPIINQPQAAILSAHAITKQVVVLPGDTFGIRSMMYLSLSFDHRIADGLLACRFAQRVCERLETMELPTVGAGERAAP